MRARIYPHFQKFTFEEKDESSFLCSTKSNFHIQNKLPTVKNFSNFRKNLSSLHKTKLLLS